MLEITPEHIAELGDADLRTLIGHLCEAELASRGLPVSSVTWGGDQRAADGGLDVRVALPERCGWALSSLTEAGRPSVSRFAEREATDWAGLGQIHGRGDDTDSASLAWRLNLTIPTRDIAQAQIGLATPDRLADLRYRNLHV